MERCAFCKVEETALYENGVPICLKCANARTNQTPNLKLQPQTQTPKPPATDQQIRSALLQDILELTARIDEASAEFDAVMRQIPSDLPQPDGLQRIKNVSAKLSTARQELMKAHRRLDEHLDRGIVPEDLKRSG